MGGWRPTHSNMMGRQCTPPATVAASTDFGVSHTPYGGRWLTRLKMNLFENVSQKSKLQPHVPAAGSVRERRAVVGRGSPCD
jgi:hypothetical protein